MFEGRLIGLAPEEIEALRSLSGAHAVVRHEWESARATFGRISTMDEMARHGVVPAGEHYLSVVRDLGRTAGAYERSVQGHLWRYTSALTMLTISVLERLVRGLGPLPQAAVRRLCAEPTLGDLHAALSISWLELLEDADDPERREKERLALLRLVGRAYDDVLYDWADITRETAGAYRLSDVGEPNGRPLYAELVGSMPAQAELLVSELHGLLTDGKR